MKIPLCAVAEARGAEVGWSLLATMEADSVQNYQPYWSLAAHLLKRMGRLEEAATAFTRAIGLCEDPAMRKYLMEKAEHI